MAVKDNQIEEMKARIFALIDAAAALNAACDGMEALRPQREAVLAALRSFTNQPVSL